MPDDREDVIEEINEENESSPVLIGSYGEFWDPEAVDWRKLSTLKGSKNRNLKGKEIEISDYDGIYVLYKDYVPVYAGKAVNEPLGSRLRKHWRSPRTKKRWDLFSWFQIVPSSTAKEASQAAVIATIEALIITVCAPRLNSRKEKLKGASLLYQIPEKGDETASLQISLQALHSDINKLTMQLDGLKKTLATRNRKRN